MYDYVDTHNCVARRVVVFKFDNHVPTNEALERLIVAHELPQIARRLLTAYAAMRMRVQAAGSFWQAVPPSLMVWQSSALGASARLRRFFDTDAALSGCVITRAPGRVTWVLDFKAAYESCVGCEFTLDTTVFDNVGFRVSDALEYVCKSCKQLAKARGGKCCDAYCHASRGKKRVIYDMEMTIQLIDDDE
jgi:hypothetical protein